MERMPAEISRYLSQLISCEGEKHLGSRIEAQQGERYFMGGFIPLHGAQGRDIGDVIALSDITEARASLRTLLIALITGGFLVGGLLFVSTYFYLGRVENEIVQSQSRVASEVEKRKRVEEDIRESEERYRTLAENLSEVIYRGDPETLQTTYVNSAVEQFYGYSVNEWLGNPALWENSIHPDDRERVFAVVQEAHRKLESVVVAYRMIRRDKTLRWVEDRVNWERDWGGKVIAVVGIVSDITRRKKAEEDLKRSGEALREQAGKLEISLKEASKQREVLVSMLEDNYLEYEEMFEVYSRDASMDRERGYQQGYSMGLYAMEKFGKEKYAQISN